MSPDLNSLSPPHRQSATESTSQTPPSPRSTSFSLAAAASINAGMQSDSRRSSTSSVTRPRNLSHTQTPPANGTPSSPRRTTQMQLNLSDPALPGPGELYSADRRSPGERRSPQAFRASPQLLGSPDSRTADPHHQRTPSLGELHQELEQEQEAQVNRLLSMIRQQQSQLQQLQASNQGSGPTPATPNTASTSAIDASTPTSERSTSFSTTLPGIQPSSARTRSPAAGGHRATLSRQNSHRSSSPGLRAIHNAVHAAGNQEEVSRDEATYYQAETSALTRENQMLKVRIRELERLLTEAKGHQPTEPAVASSLAAGGDEGEKPPE